MLNVEPSSIEDNKNFAEYGLDSLMAVELENRLLNRFKDQCVLAEATVVNNPTVEGLALYLASCSIRFNTSSFKIK